MIDRSNASCSNRKSAWRALAPSLMMALLVSGCSFSWGDGGISDVLFGGRKASELGPQGEALEEGAASAETLSANAETALTRIAIFPTGYLAQDSAQPCDLCPSTLVQKPTSRMAARLVTGFTYEAMGRHPRFLLPFPPEVDKAIAAAPGLSYRAAAVALGQAGKADFVLVSSLLELRPRVGPDDKPETPAGVALSMALLDARSGNVVWSDTFDENETGRGFITRTYDNVMNDEPVRWSTAEEHSEFGVDELVDDLIDAID